ncbi:MAG TPA: response regulator [Rudaea sp.]|nr:response regulator [Rudaea sp.]
MPAQRQPIHVLIADDDPVTLAFLRATLEQIGCNVSFAASGGEALGAARNNEFDLLLLDRCMPDLGGCVLLSALRDEGNQSPAIATSADIDATTINQLITGGFQAVVAKPLSRAQLIDAIEPIIPGFAKFSPVTASANCAFDDAAALAASGGDADIMRNLRGLLALELERLPEEILSCRDADNPDPLRQRLHRLKASCGFCGACALARAAIRLDEVLRQTPHDAQSALTDLLHACQMTLDELHRQGMSLPAEK